MVTVHTFSTLASSAFSTKIRPSAITMPTRHKALQSMMRDITNVNTVVTRALTGHVSLITVLENDMLSD